MKIHNKIASRTAIMPFQLGHQIRADPSIRNCEP